MPPPKRRPEGLRALAETVTAITAPLAGRAGTSARRLACAWPSIVGDALAARSLPEKISRGSTGDGGTLHVRVGSGALALELQHLEQMIVQRINGYLGYRAVARLRLLHAPLPESRAALPPIARPLPPPPEALATAVAGIENAGLRRALFDLGRRLFAHRPSAEG